MKESKKTKNIKQILIVINIRMGVVLYDNFENLIYFGWEEKSPEEQKKILTSRKNITFTDAYGKISEKLHREIYKLPENESIKIGSCWTVVLKRKPSEMINMIDYDKTDILVQ